MAGPWCNLIAGTGYIKSTNDESLARDEGGGSNLFMQVATSKTVQECRLRMTPATATFVFRLWLQLCVEPPSSKGEHGGFYDLQAARPPQDTIRIRPADLIDNDNIRRGCVGKCNSEVLVKVTTMTVSLPVDIIGTEGG